MIIGLLGFFAFIPISLLCFEAVHYLYMISCGGIPLALGPSLRMEGMHLSRGK